MLETNSFSASTAPRILVVDDDAAVRTMLVRVLAEAGYLAYPAASGPEAVRVSGRFEFDLVLLDLGMAGEDGWTTLIQLHAHDPELPVFIITAWPNQHAAAWTAGASGCFEKPLDFGELLGAIERLFRTGADAGRSHDSGARPLQHDERPSTSERTSDFS